MAPDWAAQLAVHGVVWARPNWLWWGLAAWLVPVLAPWGLTDLPRPQQALQALLRTALVVLLVVAAAGPQMRRDQPRSVHVLHLIDRSDSVPDALRQAALAGVRTTAQALAGGSPASPLQHAGPKSPPDDRDARMDVVLFDRHAHWAAQETAGDAPLAVTCTDDPTAGADTDLAAALNRALGLVDGRRVAHVVVWSDGVETRGDALELVPALQAAGLRVDVPKLPNLPRPAEFLVDQLRVPEVVRAGVPFPVVALVEASEPTTVRCALRAGTQQPSPVTRTLPAGASELDLGTLRLREAGARELAVDCTPTDGRDRFAGNNGLRARVTVRARPRLLYVEGAVNQAQYLERALADDFEVTTVPADGLPRSLGGLKAYAAVVLSDVARVSPAGVPQVTDGDMRNLDAYVRGGGGLLVLGGENSLGSGGYQGTFLDQQTLPVRMDVDSAVEAPTVALMLCVDKSGSMQGPKMELAKEAARATARALAPEDRIGVVAFDTEARLAVRPQRASNSYKIDTDIAKLQPSGGTAIYPALDQAFSQLQAVEAKLKHVIVMTDGQAPRQGIDALVRQMRKAGVTVSSVGVGTDVDRSMLEAIADRGGGRAWFTDRPETLPRIFVKETKMISGQSVVERAVRPRLATGARVDLLRGVRLEAAPNLTGYLPTKVKPGAELILRTSTGAPLLVRWRLGLGKVAVWTSDLKNRWAAAWLDWPDYAVLARQLARDVLQEQFGAEVAVQLLRERDRLRLAVDAWGDDDSWLQGLRGAAEVHLPDGATLTVPLPEVAEGHYETTVPMVQLGPYDVQVTLRAAADQPVLASGRATAVHPYPDELRPGEPDLRVLHQLAEATGGRRDSVLDDWLDTAGAVRRGEEPLWPELVRLALLLLLVDVGLRRVRLGRARATRWHELGR
jgi:uncharacterized membrane protein